MGYKFLSLGAGVQSSTIFLMSCYGEIERIDAAVFADTGWEPKAVYEWLKFLRKEGLKYGIPIYIVNYRNLRDYAILGKVRGRNYGKIDAPLPYHILWKDGSKGMLGRHCTDHYKIRPCNKKFRALAGYKKYQRIPIGEIEVWKGISIDEVRRAKMSKIRWISFYYPLIEMRMDRLSCLAWFDKKGLSRPPRSACIGCPYHHNNEWRDMRDNRPDEWQDAVEFDRAIRKCGGMRGDCFIHADRIPLDQVNLDKNSNQLSLFRDECAGVCGV